MSSVSSVPKLPSLVAGGSTVQGRGLADPRLTGRIDRRGDRESEEGLFPFLSVRGPDRSDLTSMRAPSVPAVVGSVEGLPTLPKRFYPLGNSDGEGSGGRTERVVRLARRALSDGHPEVRSILRRAPEEGSQARGLRRARDSGVGYESWPHRVEEDRENLPPIRQQRSCDIEYKEPEEGDSASEVGHTV